MKETCSVRSAIYGQQMPHAYDDPVILDMEPAIGPDRWCVCNRPEKVLVDKAEWERLIARYDGTVGGTDE